MHQPDLEAKPQFTQPTRQVILMLLVIALSVGGAVLALPRVLPVFQTNPYLNGFILFVFLIGLVACFWQVAQLITSVRWIEQFVANRDVGRQAQAPLLLAPLAALLRQRARQMQINATSTRSILDSVATRIDEAREITRYIVSLLIFLGLLGTFYGLATTVPALVETIQSLAPEEGETGAQVFSRLMSGLESQLGGMGVAFASSLLGLACSLIVGLLELFAGHGQNRFYRELEEWLSTITRLGFSHGEEGEGGPDLGAAGLVLDQMAEQMERMQLLFTQSDQGRSSRNRGKAVRPRRNRTPHPRHPWSTTR
ncbi:MAG: biopolymer transporter ExbB, partial [Paracoccaceae bacterium]|nr:biopolymer transporter ExbB [Paracoccaceae bacterium]